MEVRWHYGSALDYNAAERGSNPGHYRPTANSAGSQVDGIMEGHRTVHIGWLQQRQDTKNTKNIRRKKTDLTSKKADHGILGCGAKKCG